ncbi:Spore germination protein A3 precursor [compost metagenome]
MIILKVRTNIHTRIVNNKPSIGVHILATGRINANDTDLDLSRTETITVVEEKYEKELHKAINGVITVSQQEFKSDIFGFGRQMHIDHPYVWKKIKEQWDELYPTLPIEVRTEVRIERIGRTQAPAQLMKY